MLFHGTRENTTKSYNLKWEKWVDWCHSKSHSPLHPSIPVVADFLMMLFNKGLTVSTFNGYRSAISSTVTCFDDISLGNHPVMIKLFKGFPNIRPALYW